VYVGSCVTPLIGQIVCCPAVYFVDEFRLNCEWFGFYRWFEFYRTQSLYTSL